MANVQRRVARPRAVVLLSGKRKSGKDYISELLINRLGASKCSILRLSGPLKEQYAKEHNLDFHKLLDATEYKEKYRADMIRWGEEKRNKDPEFFCQHATSGEGSEKDIWIISDARRLTDVEYFEERYGDRLISVRVEAAINVRQKRGFVFTEGVDDAESECGLDSGVNWTFTIANNGGEGQFEGQVNDLLQRILSVEDPNQ